MQITLPLPVEHVTVFPAAAAAEPTVTDKLEISAVE
jgi:hypothetical protein